MNQYKKYFPIFEKLPDLVYLDNGATTLKPKQTVDKMVEYYTQYSANIHRGIYDISEKATAEYEGTRDKVARFLGVDDREEIVFTAGATAGLNLIATGWGNRNISDGDQIVTTAMEHHSNLVPWQQLAKRQGAILKFLPVTDFKLDLTDLDKIINSKTKILAVTHVSNVLGTINPIGLMAAAAKKINPDILVVVDGAQAVAHMPVSVTDLAVDFYVFSGHKMYGPTGVGVVWGKKLRWQETDPVNFGGGMINEVSLEASSWAPLPERFEGGTPPIGEVIGLGGAIDFIEDIGFEAIIKQENEVLRYGLTELSKISGLTIWSSRQSGIISFNLSGIHPHDVASILDGEKVAVRAGHHCAMPLHQILGNEATVRASVGIYNQTSDIDRLVLGIKKIKYIFQI